MKPVLVTGATGYVGARLVARLRSRGYPVRAAGRSDEHLRLRPFSRDPGVELATFDVLDPPSVRRSCSGCSTAYYLVHSMDTGQRDFRIADREGARNMAEAAEREGLERIIYLGGLGDPGPGISEHLRSRLEVGRILGSGKIPVTTLRAAMVIGGGSGSFEILRYLVERLPVMITPRWISTESQPIAIRNVLDYLVGVLEAPETAGGTFDVGGPEVATYRRLMDLYAEEAGLRKRWILPVPFLTPRLSSYWIDRVTPVPAALARPLANGLSNRVVCGDERIRRIVPVELLDCRAAIRVAVVAGRPGFTGNGVVREAGSCDEAGIVPGDPEWAGGTVCIDHRQGDLEAAPEEVWSAIARWGENSAWKVVAMEPPWRRLLRAETGIRGRAMLEFVIRPEGVGSACLHRIVRFEPKGLGGIIYWRGTWLLRRLSFGRMLRRIGRESGRRTPSGGIP